MAGGYGDCMEGIAALSVWDSRLVCIYSVHSLLWLVGMGSLSAMAGGYGFTLCYGWWVWVHSLLWLVGMGSLSAMAGGYGDCMEGIAALSVWDSRASVQCYGWWVWGL